MNELELAVLRGVLESQTFEDAEGFIPYERIRDVLTSGQKFTREEKRLIWLNADVRETYFLVRTDLDRETQWALDDAGYTTPVRLLAAAGEEDVTYLPGNGYTVTVFRDLLPSGMRWSISLQLDERLRDLLFPNTLVSLVDNGGLTWVSGIPDETGQLGSMWSQKEEPPLERFAKHGIRIGI